ncbi:MAG TPA: extracellular solute-binding protein [Burkholderiales bacterium]|nr:extracellular solute-binding protein [Burkholderiales bacterium]
MKGIARGFLYAVFLSALLQTSASAEEVVLRAYGPGGPAPAMREAAKAFGRMKGIRVKIVAGPTPVWKNQAMKNADLIFSGSEYMMTGFIRQDLPDLIDAGTTRTLYLRPSAILVRPGNPKNIRGIKDLARPGINVLVVQGAGQTGLWEDVAGRTGNAELVDSVRRNIGYFAPSSAEAKKRWARNKGFDAWIIWTIWQKASPSSADLVDTEPENTIYRSCGIALTNRSENKALGKAFADFLQSPAGHAIFVKWGWL